MSEPERQFLLGFLGLILFIGFAAGKEWEFTYRLVGLFFIVVVITHVYKKGGLKEVYKWGATWILSAVIILAFLIGGIWYMSKPNLVIAGGYVAGAILGLIGLFLVGSMLWAIGSVVIDKLKKR